MSLSTVQNMLLNNNNNFLLSALYMEIIVPKRFRGQLMRIHEYYKKLKKKCFKQNEVKLKNCFKVCTFLIQLKTMKKLG